MLPGARSREQIGLALRPEASDTQVRNAFRVTLHAMRRALGGRDRLVFDGGALVARDPLREAVHRELMRACAAAGEPARAARHYDALAELLRRELGAGPARETAALAASLRGEAARV